MTHRKQVRLAVWIAAGAVVLAGDLFARPVGVFVGLAVTVVLLRTTPVRAIRLRRWHSDVLIFLGSILVMPWRWSAVAVFGLTATSLMWLRITRRSPWWTVLVAWNVPAVAAGWTAVAASAAAVIVPVLAFTGLAFSSGESRWIVIAGLVCDAAFFRARRIRRLRK